MTALKTLLIATTNPRKCKEMEEILSAADLDFELKTLIDYPDYPDVEETGETFEQNALLKAEAAFKHTGLPSIADDGGLCIDALDGQPGVKSHRFLGENTSFPDKMTKILDMMRDVKGQDRSCRFQCCVAIVIPGAASFIAKGTCEGMIAEEMLGKNGFGYDPIFFLPDTKKHMAELTPEEKHRISHRGKALAAAAEYLKQCK